MESGKNPSGTPSKQEAKSGASLGATPPRAAAARLVLGDVDWDGGPGGGRMVIRNKELGRAIRAAMGHTDSTSGTHSALIRIDPITPSGEQGDPGVIVDARC